MHLQNSTMTASAAQLLELSTPAPNSQPAPVWHWPAPIYWPSSKVRKPLLVPSRRPRQSSLACSRGARCRRCSSLRLVRTMRVGLQLLELLLARLAPPGKWRWAALGLATREAQQCNPRQSVMTPSSSSRGLGTRRQQATATTTGCRETRKGSARGFPLVVRPR